MNNNTLLLFKDKDPRMSQHARHGKVFFHELCTGNCVSYSVDRINQIFGMERNPEHLKERMVSMMMYLQRGYHSGTYEGPAGHYPHAQEEYPKRYVYLVDGLTEETLAAIQECEHDIFIPDDATQRFCRQLLQDKEDITRQRRLTVGIEDAGTEAAPLSLAM